MTQHFLYPADVLKPKQVDEMYAPEAAAMRAAGFSVAVVPLEALGCGQAKITPGPVCGQKLVYRGWMVSPEEYEKLAAVVAAHGAELCTSPAQYRLAHYLPNWYPLLQELTPETEVVPADADLERILRDLGWGRYFIKDYVKSLKTSVGSIVERPEDVAVVVAEMQKYRGKIEGGLCIRRVESFLPETERRYFVIGGAPTASSVSLRSAMARFPTSSDGSRSGSPKSGGGSDEKRRVVREEVVLPAASRLLRARRPGAGADRSLRRCAGSDVPCITGRTATSAGTTISGVRCW